MNWVDRYHLALGCTALVIGLAVVAADRWGPLVVRERALAVCGLAGALLGGWGSPRAWPWWLVCGALVLLPDRPSPEREHPLGSWTGLLTIAGLVGVWAAVPDTEPALAVAGVLLPLAAVAARSRRATGPVGTAVLVVAVVGSVWVGAAAWGAALAAVCAVGAVAVAPAVLGFGEGLVGRSLAWLAGAHLVVVVAVPRLVMERSVTWAWAVASCSLLLLGVVAATVATPWWRRSELRVR